MTYAEKLSRHLKAGVPDESGSLKLSAKECADLLYLLTDEDPDTYEPEED